MPHMESPDDHLFSPQDHDEDVSVPLSIALEIALILANLFPICVVIKYKNASARLATDELIVALSITDILSVVIPSPIGLVAYFSHQWYGGQRTCEFYQVTVVWFQLTSMCLVTFMCLDRWMSLRDAMAYKTSMNGHKRIRLAIVMVYAFTLLVSCLPLFGLAPEAFSVAGDYCQSWLIARPKTATQRAFFSMFLTVGYANLLTAIVVNCTVIVTLCRFQKKFGIKPSERLNGAAMQIDRKTVVEFSVMVLIVTAVFYLAWLPALTMITLQQLGVEVGKVAVVYSLLSTTLTGLLNPVIYGTFSKAYRLAYTRLIVALSKLLFGCPLSQQDVLSDISSQARHMHSGANASNSTAALISQRSNGAIECGSCELNVKTLTPVNENSCISTGTCNSQLLLPREGSTNCTTSINPSGAVGDNQPCARGDTLDMHERTYFGELLTQRDGSYGQLTRDRFGSSLSLISEDSGEMCEESSVEGYASQPNLPSSNTDCTNQPIVQESII